MRGWFAQILATYATAPGKGLPIGSLISQHLANSYLAPFDRLVKQELRIAGYVRYMDDAVLWSDSKDRLFDSLPGIEGFLGRHLHLEVKGVPFLNRTVHGMNFLGMRVLPGHCRLSAASRRRFRRRVRSCLDADQAGEATESETQQRWRALVAFTTPARAWLRFMGSGLFLLDLLRGRDQKAPLKRTHSKRFAPLQGTSGAAKRLECGDSSPLFGAGSWEERRGTSALRETAWVEITQ